MKAGKLKSDLRGTELENPVLIGDHNIRIGAEQQDLEDIYHNNPHLKTIRQSKNKTVNTKGKEYLEFCSEENLCIMNGKTDGDELGEYTFVSTIGKSVNDICDVNCEFLKNILDFKVVQRIESDHMPIELTIELGNANNDYENLNLLPKLTWKEQFKEKYHNDLSSNLDNLKTQQDNITLTDLSNLITESAIKPNLYKKIYSNARMVR